MKTPAFLIASIACSCAVAGPLDADNVSSRASWIVHLDVEAVLSSSLGRLAMDHVTVNDDWGEAEQVFQMLQFDPTEDVYSITAYGSSADETNHVVIVEASGAAEGLLDRVEAIAEGEVTFREHSVGGHALAAAIGPNGEEQAWLHFDQQGRDRWRIVASPSRGLLRHALDVTAGDAESMDDSGGAISRIRMRSGTFLVAGATEAGHLNNFEPASEVLKAAEQIIVLIGEDDEDLFASARVTVREEEDARSISNVVMGATSLVQLLAASNEDAAEFADLLRHIDVSSSGRTIAIDCSVPLDLIGEHLDALDGGYQDNDDGDEDEEEGWWNRN